MTEAIWFEIDHLLTILLVFGFSAMKANFETKILCPFELLSECCKVSRTRITTQLKANDPSCLLLVRICSKVLLSEFDKQLNRFRSTFSWCSSANADDKSNLDRGNLRFHFTNSLKHCVNVLLFRLDFPNYLGSRSKLKISCALLRIILNDFSCYLLECFAICYQLGTNFEDFKSGLDINFIEVDVIDINFLCLCQFYKGLGTETSSDMRMQFNLAIE